MIKALYKCTTLLFLLFNSPNPSSVYVRLCKHRKKVFYCFYKITSSKNYNAGKDKKIHFTDQNVSSYNIDLTMGILNWPIKTFILKIWWWRVCNVCTTLRHTTRLTYSHTNTPLGQSESASRLPPIFSCFYVLDYVALSWSSATMSVFRSCHWF